ncbi:O-antigen translocase [Flavobacterium sp. JP2137]|uniref:O-antigen translocase n=1 Tax=Flavobacterium sp. JP2137 TaxID=3414510 RepID=UPI003D2FE4B7
MRSKLFQVSFWNNVNMCIRLLTGITTAKLIAIYVGPGGMALMGNFRNFLASLESVSTLGFQNGIVKYVSEYRKDGDKRAQFVAVLVVAIALFSLLISALAFGFRAALSDYIFDKTFSLEFLFIVLAFAFPFQAFSVVFVSIINGLERFKQLMFIHIVGNLLAFGVTAVLVYYWTLNGALLALVLGPAVVGIIAFFAVLRDLWPMLKAGFEKLDFSLLRPLFSFSLMALFSGTVGPAVLFVIRNYLMDNLGIVAGGYWEAVNRIAGFYMMFITTLVAVYFLPKLAAAENSRELRHEIRKYLQWILPVFGLGLLIVYQWRELLISLLMTDRFLPVSDILAWQLIGDFLKAASLIFGIMFYAKRVVLAYLVTEGLSFVVLWGSSVYLIDHYGLVGATMAHAVTYLFYLIMLLLYFRKKI